MSKHAISYPNVIEKVGHFTVIPEYGWYLCDDGSIWYATLKLVSNQGTPAEFMKFANDLKIRWCNGYPEKLQSAEY